MFLLKKAWSKRSVLANQQRLIGSALLLIGLLGMYAALPRTAQSEAGATTIQKAELHPETWNYLPASQPQADGLLIKNSDFKIVEQDGSGGQANPPVNLYGPHLAVRGDVTLTATLDQLKGRSAIQFYASAPIIQDEFRVDPAYVRAEITGNQLSISTNKSKAQSYAIDGTQQVMLQLQRKSQTLVLSVNGKQLATFMDPGIFSKDEVWFGADNNGGSYLLRNLGATAQRGGSIKVIDSKQIPQAKTNGQTLQAAASAKRPDFKVGTTAALAPLTSDNAYRSLVLGGNFGSITTENALKWQFVEPSANDFNFQEADAIVDQATKHNLAIHGHTLVFGEANPAWVQKLPTATETDRQHVQDVMNNHIKTVVGHYKGKIASWDVVNEPLADYDDFDSNNGTILRNHIWYKAMGETYIATAFATAHQTDPDAKLYINEYGLEADGERWDAFLTLVTKLKKQGVPIDGVGFESHVYSSDDVIDPAVLKTHMQQLAAIGLNSRVSEMDVYDDDGTSVQVNQFSSVLQACITQPSCVSFTTWGATDRYDMFMEDGKVEYGHDLLWSDRYQPTPAVKAMFAILSK